jgi:hypothetical protein
MSTGTEQLTGMRRIHLGGESGSLIDAMRMKATMNDEEEEDDGLCLYEICAIYLCFCLDEEARADFKQFSDKIKGVTK